MPDTTTARRLAAVPDLPEQERAEDRETNRQRIERHVLGTAMDRPAEIPGIRIHVETSAFTGAHAAIWDAIVTCHDSSEPVHPTAVTERLINAGHIGRLPHNAYLFELYQQSLPGQGSHWARLLAERHTWDRVNAGTRKIKATLDTPGASLDQVAQLAEHLATVAAGRGANTATDGEHIADLTAAYIDGYLNWGQARGAATPWNDLNELLTTGGLERGQVVTFGGASGMGKSVAITDVARHHGVELQMPTLLFTMEMTADQVLCRVLAGLTGIPERLIKNRDLDHEQLIRVDEARRRFDDAPLWIIAGPRTVTQIANTIRQHKHRYGNVHTVVVDYVQIVPTEGRKENRQLEVSATMQRLKQLALKEDVLVVSAAQINRAPAQRPDKRPTLADLRESGEIENSSDIVVLIFREDYYDKESPRAGEADFIVAKQRGGALDTITLASQLHLTRFVSIAVDWSPAGAAQ